MVWTLPNLVCVPCHSPRQWLSVLSNPQYLQSMPNYFPYPANPPFPLTLCHQITALATPPCCHSSTDSLNNLAPGTSSLPFPTAKILRNCHFYEPSPFNTLASWSPWRPHFPSDLILHPTSATNSQGCTLNLTITNICTLPPYIVHSPHSGERAPFRTHMILLC